LNPALVCFSRSLLWGVPLLLLLVMPWFVWAAQQTDGRLLRCFVWYHNIERAFGGGQLRGHPWWFYGPRLFVDFLPWSILLPFAVWDFCRGGRWRDDATARFGLVWLVAVVLVLSCVRFKRADYLLPAYPGAALFLGQVITRRCEEMSSEARPGRWRIALGALLGLVMLGSAIGWGYFVTRVLPRAEPVRECRSFAAAIREVAPPPQLVIFFRVESHALAFHVGRPLNTVLEWENINTWAGRPGEHYFVMPPDCAREWAQHITAADLEVVGSNADTLAGPHEHPLVLLRTVGKGRD
jgi:hypothetical protein